jgi:pimeloyl-ACP methyl ester carboxylesterase
LQPEGDFLARLAGARRLIAPSHPGFGRSGLPDWLDHVADIAHLYLALIDRLEVARCDLVGCSLGGWIAAEIASMVPERLRRLILVGPVGVKLGPVDRLDIPDLFALPPEAIDRLLYADPSRMQVEPAALSDEALRITVRNRETLALLTWEPYMHDPKLRHRLHRVGVPTLLLRGAADGVVSAEYLAGYARLIPGAVSDSIAAAGHLPHLEQPAAFADRVLRFLGAKA